MTTIPHPARPHPQRRNLYRGAGAAGETQQNTVPDSCIRYQDLKVTIRVLGLEARFFPKRLIKAHLEKTGKALLVSPAQEE